MCKEKNLVLGRHSAFQKTRVTIAKAVSQRRFRMQNLQQRTACMCGKSGLNFRKKKQEKWEHAPQHCTPTLATLLPTVKEKDVTYLMQTCLDGQADGVSASNKNTSAGRVCVWLCVYKANHSVPLQ